MRYLRGGTSGEDPASAWFNHEGAFDHPVMQPQYLAVEDANGRPLTAPARNDEALFVTSRVDVRQLDPALCVGLALYNEDSHLLLLSLTTDGPEESWPTLERGLVEVRCALPVRFLNEGAYRLELNASLHRREWLSQPGLNSPAVHFRIQGGLSDSPYWLEARPGILAPAWRWDRTN